MKKVLNRVVLVRSSVQGKAKSDESSEVYVKASSRNNLFIPAKKGLRSELR